MRVALLVTDLERGGTPIRIADTARGLRDLGLEPLVGCLAPLGPVGHDLSREGIGTFACEARSAWDFAAVGRLRRALSNSRPDIVHSTLLHANVAARLACRKLGIPLLTSTATIEVERRWHAAAERWTRNWDAGHVVGSQALADHVVRAFRRDAARVHVVPPMIARVPSRVDRRAARRSFGVPDGAFVVAWAGRLDPVKRVDLLMHTVDAMAECDVHLLIAGDGPERSTLPRLSATMRVKLLGWQDDLGPLLSAADLLAFPSRTEGVPNVVLQAMAFGLPVLASDIPAHRELAGEDRIALVPDERPASWTTAIAGMQDDPSRRTRLANAAQRWAAALLGTTRHCTALHALYTDVLRRTAPTPR